MNNYQKALIAQKRNDRLQRVVQDQNKELARLKREIVRLRR